MSRTDLTCNEAMPTSDEKLDGRAPLRQSFGGPSTSTGQPRFVNQQPKPSASRALYPGSLIPSMSGIPHGLTLPGSSTPSTPKPAANPVVPGSSAASAALVAQREAEIRRDVAKQKEEEERAKKSYEDALRRSAGNNAGPSNTTTPGIIRPTPTMPGPYGNPMLSHPSTSGNSASRPMNSMASLAGHDYFGSNSSMIRDPQVKQIAKGGGLVHAPYNPAMKSRMEQQMRDAAPHIIARPIARHVEHTSAAAQLALHQAAQAQHEALQARHRLFKEQRDAETRAQIQHIERERQALMERQRLQQEEERQMKAEMQGAAPIVRPVQRGNPMNQQPMLDPTRMNRGLPPPANHRFIHQQMVTAQAMANAAAAAAAAAQAQKEREEQEKFERERDRLERAYAEPLTLPPIPHPSPLHIPNILQGRNNWPRINQQNNTPLRSGYSPGLGNSSGMPPSFDTILGLANSAPRMHQNLFGINSIYGPNQHMSPGPSTPQVMATPSPRPSILRRKGTDASAAKRRLAFDESNPQTVGEFATAQLNSGLIGISDPKKLKLDAEIKKEVLDMPSTSSVDPLPASASAVKQEPGVSSSTEPTPQKKRQRKQQFDANQAPEQIRMQISEPPYMPMVGMHSAGEMLYYQLPPEAPKKKRGRPSTLAKEQAMLEAQGTTRSIIVDVDEPKIVKEKKRGRKKKELPTPGLTYPLVPPVSTVKEEPIDVPATPPPRPSSSARPKSIILQQHQAALQQQLEQKRLEDERLQQEAETPKMIESSPQPTSPPPPPPQEQSPFTYADVDDFPLEFDSDEDLVSAEALEAARAVALDLGLIGPDGEPRESTPMRRAREEEEREEEEERNRELYEGLHSSLPYEVPIAMRQMEKQVRKEEERKWRKEEQAEKKEIKSLLSIDRRIRFLSHDESIVQRFIRKVKGHKIRDDSSESDEEEKKEQIVENEEEQEDGRTSALSVSTKSGSSDQSSGESEEEEESEKTKESPVKNVEEEEKEEEEEKVEEKKRKGEKKRNIDPDMLTLTEKEMKRMKARGVEFDIVRETDDSESEEEDEEEEVEDEGQESEEESEEEMTEEQIQEIIQIQDTYVKRLNLNRRFGTLMSKKKKAIDSGKRTEELEAELAQMEKCLAELNEQESFVEEVEDAEKEEDEIEDAKKDLIPLDALGDRDNFLNSTRKLLIAPSEHLISTRRQTQKDLDKLGKSKAVKKAFGIMKLWKRVHESSEETKGVTVNEPLDIEEDLIKARRRDKMIERAFNRLKKKADHDMLRQKIREEIVEKRRLEKKNRDYEGLDAQGKIIWKLADDMLDTIERKENEAKEQKEKEEKEKKERERLERKREEEERRQKEEEEKKIIEHAKMAEEEKNMKVGDESLNDDVQDEEEKVEDEEGEGDEEMEEDEYEDQEEIEEEEEESETESEEEEESEDEEIIDPIEMERIQKENEEILKIAIEEVDAKILRREERMGVAKSLKSYFSNPRNTSTHDSDLFETLDAIQKRHLKEAAARGDLEELLQEILWSSEEEDNGEVEKEGENKEDYEIEAEEKEEEESEDDESHDEMVKVATDLVKLASTKKSRIGIPIEEWDSLSSSFHQTEVVDLFGVPFAQCDEGKLVPIITEEEHKEEKEAHLMEKGKHSIKQVESRLKMKSRYQDDDALPRAITRFRRNQAVDNAMMRDEQAISHVIDPEVGDLEDQAIDILTMNINSTKREALLERQMVNMEMIHKKKKRSSSPNLFYKKNFSKKSIMGDYSVNYNARELFITGDGKEPKESHQLRSHLIRSQFERLNEKRRAKLDKLVESAITLREERQELPCPSKYRQDAAKKTILNKYSKKTRSLMLKAYNKFFDSEGHELCAATSSGEKREKKKSPSRSGLDLSSLKNNENRLVRDIRMAQFLEENELQLEEIPAEMQKNDSFMPPSPVFNRLKEFVLSKDGDEDDSGKEDTEVKDEGTEQGIAIQKERKEQDALPNEDLYETFELESIREIYETTTKTTEVEVKEEIPQATVDDKESSNETPKAPIEQKEGERISDVIIEKEEKEIDSDEDDEQRESDAESEGLFDQYPSDYLFTDEEDGSEEHSGYHENEGENVTKDAELKVKSAEMVTVSVKEFEKVVATSSTLSVPPVKVTKDQTGEKEEGNEPEKSEKENGRDDNKIIKVEEIEGEEKESDEKEDDDDDKYEDHVVTMTRGGKTITQIVRRPSNAAAIMNIPRRIIKTNNIDIDEEGKPRKRIFVKKITGDDEEQNEDVTYYEAIEEDDPLLMDNKEMINEVKRIEKIEKMREKILKRQDKWEINEEEKEQIADEIEDELEEGEREEEDKSEESDTEYDRSDEDDSDCIHGVQSSGSSSDEVESENDEDEEVEEEEEEEEEEEKEDSTSSANTSMDTSADSSSSFPWLDKLDEYEPFGGNKHQKKLIALRRKVVENIEKRKESIKPRVVRFKLPTKEKNHISPFHSLYMDELPDELANDLEVMKLIIKTTISDGKISTAELVALRKKANLAKKQFAEVIKRKCTKPPKAFKDLVLFAIKRGEQYNKRERDVRAIQRWQQNIDYVKIGRTKRKAIIKQVKVARRKLNVQFGRKFRRSDWSLKKELEDRWRKNHLLPAYEPPPRMGFKQFLQEMRKSREVDEEHNKRGEKTEIENEIEEQIKLIEARNERLRMGKSEKKKEDHKEFRTMREILVLFDRRSDEIKYSDDEVMNDDETEEQFSDGSISTTSTEERQRRERSWTFETVNNSDDDESFIDFGHEHWIGPQVFLNGENSPKLEEIDRIIAAPKLVIPPGTFPDTDTVVTDEVTCEATTSSAVQPVTASTPTKSEDEPRPFLTLAQRKAYFTEDQEKKVEEENDKKEDEKKRKEISTEEEEKRKEEERIAEKELKKKEEELKEEKAAKFEAIIRQIDEDTWEKQLKMIIDRTMTSFRRSAAIEFLIESCEEIGCSEEKMNEEIELWESEAEEKRIASESSEFLPLKSLFNANTSFVLRKGMKVERKKKDLLSALPNRVVIEDLVDSMCTFVAAHVDDGTILSQFRMTSEKNPPKIRSLPAPPKKNELLVKKSIAAVGIEESEMVKKTLEDTPYNSLFVIGETSSGVILNANRDENSLLDEVSDELNKNDRDEAEINASGTSLDSKNPKQSHHNSVDFTSLAINVVSKLGISCKSEVDSIENAMIDDAIARGSSPDLKGFAQFAGKEQEGTAPAPICATVAPKQKKIRTIESDFISNFILREISDQLKAVEKKSGKKNKANKIEMPRTENSKLRDEFLRLRDVITAARKEIQEEMGKVISDEKLNEYLAEHIWSDNSANVQLLINDLKKQKERERRKLIDIGELTARVFDLSAVGQLERWVDDIFYLSPFSEDGKKVAAQLSKHENSTLHYQFVLRDEEDEDNIVRRIQPEIVIKWSEKNEDDDHEERKESVHKFSSLPVHQWDVIQRLIRLAKEEREADGVTQEDNEGETPVLVPIKSNTANIVIVENGELNVDQEDIVSNKKFAELELRHSARLLKRKLIGFKTKNAKNHWRNNYIRAFKTGRIMKKVIDDNTQMKHSASTDIRQSIRHKAIMNSIKQAKGITKKRVELLGKPMQEEQLKMARSAVRRQKKAIRMHYKKIVMDEMREYNETMKLVIEKRKKKQLKKRLVRLKEEQKDFDERNRPFELAFPLSVRIPATVKCERVKTEDLLLMAASRLEMDSFFEIKPRGDDKEKDKEEVDKKEEEPSKSSLAPRVESTSNVLVPSPNGVKEATVPNNSASLESDGVSQDSEESDIVRLERQLASAKIRKTPSTEDETPVENNVVTLKDVLENVANIDEVDMAVEKIPIDESLMNNFIENCIAAACNQSEMVEREDETPDKDAALEEIKNETSVHPLHPLKKRVKTLEELCRPLNEKEQKLLMVLKEKRAKGETLLCTQELYKAPKIIPIEEGRERDEDDIDIEVVSDEDEEDGEVDIECVLFHSYSERVRKVLVKALEKQEVRRKEHEKRYQMYRRAEDRRIRKEIEKKMEEKERKKVEKEQEKKKRKNRNGKRKNMKKKGTKKEDEKKEEDKEMKWESGMECVEDEIPHGFVPMWTTKIIGGKKIKVRTVVYKKWLERRKLRRGRVVLGRISRGRKIPLTRLSYVITGKKSEDLVHAEADAARAQNAANNILVDMDTSNVPINKDIIGHFVENQIKSEDEKLRLKERLVDEHDVSVKKKGLRLLTNDVLKRLKEEDEIERMIEEDRNHEKAMETYKKAVEMMRDDAITRRETDAFTKLDQEIDEAVENERRILADYLKVLHSMDSVGFKELASQWTYDISSDDDEESLEEKRWARVRQFVLQKPIGGPKNWESTTAYVDEWEEQGGVPTTKEVVEALGPQSEEFRGEETKEREGYYINDQGFPVKPRKPRQFKPLVEDPEYLTMGNINEMCHKDLNVRHEDNLIKRRNLADRCNREFEARQDVVRERGLKRRAALMKKFKKNEKNMPPMGAGLQWTMPQDSVYDSMTVTESYWSYLRRKDRKMNALLRRRLDHTREMFAAVVQPMHRTVLVLKETKNRLEHHIATKDLDPDDERRRYREESDEDSESSVFNDDDEDHPTYVLRKRPRLCVRHEEEDDGDDEAEESDRDSSRSDSEREESDDEEEEEDDDVIIEEQPKKPKKPTLFNRVIKRELVYSPDFDLSKVKEEEPEEDPSSPAIIDVTPKRRPQVKKKGRPRKNSDRSDSDSPYYEAPPTSLRRGVGKRPLMNEGSVVDYYDEDEQIRLAIEESLKDQPSTSKSGNY